MTTLSEIEDQFVYKLSQAMPDNLPAGMSQVSVVLPKGLVYKTRYFR